MNRRKFLTTALAVAPAVVIPTAIVAEPIKTKKSFPLGLKLVENPKKLPVLKFDEKGIPSNIEEIKKWKFARSENYYSNLYPHHRNLVMEPAEELDLKCLVWLNEENAFCDENSVYWGEVLVKISKPPKCYESYYRSTSALFQVKNSMKRNLGLSVFCHGICDEEENEDYEYDEYDGEDEHHIIWHYKSVLMEMSWTFKPHELFLLLDRKLVVPYTYVWEKKNEYVLARNLSVDKLYKYLRETIETTRTAKNKKRLGKFLDKLCKE